MITTIKTDGTLFVKAETEIEGFALKQWANLFLQEWQVVNPLSGTPPLPKTTIIVDFSLK